MTTDTVRFRKLNSVAVINFKNILKFIFKSEMLRLLQKSDLHYMNVDIL